MSASKAPRFFTVVAGLWVGSMLAAGYLVAPALFTILTDHQVAGMIAGDIFRIEAYLSFVVCLVLLVMANRFVKQGQLQYQSMRWLLLAMLMCSLIGSVVLLPWMSALRDQTLLEGMPVMQSPAATMFGRLHGVSSIVYLIQSLLGIKLVWDAAK
ncbi:DUF4149 domain-containing protein [Polynucleobacter sp. MWH-P3-07-1]|uniref:DUF4149 domain-containing protein n=1 Tax=Polynucleobacter sp. MWH-P3-07-1 TaxID=1743173 RepID=UPI00203D5728|nr:DUF4149 domain-containing protein [Polynucleobacter sp. MWH-P3-07-1]